MKIEKSCINCKKLFMVFLSLKNKRKFCSLLCRKEYFLKKKNKCLDCNCIIIGHDKKTKRCKECFNKYMIGSNNHRWLGGKSYCIDCGIKTSSYNCSRCFICFKKYNKKSNHSCWRGGITPINNQIRNSYEYKDWRLYIFVRDNYTCVLCNNKGCKLNVHHIRKFSMNKDLRLDKKNGITLCKKCHQNYVNRREEEYEDYFDILILGREEYVN